MGLLKANMKAGFLPDQLVTICSLLVMKTHSSQGFGDLARRLASKQNTTSLACIPDMLTIMRGIDGGFKLRIAFWLLGLGLIIAAWAFDWRIVLGLLVVIAADRHFSSSDRKSWMVLASVLLSLEVLANDFAGWGSAYPGERDTALGILGGQRCEWLDYYLPRRASLTPELLHQFGPVS
jgi:hypothetical protein